ncbi:hypothetical protein HALDL1_02825 [Halobacterium sp. DL1]|jgi:hypothetical protein|nr:hypothetical protein HALDL1_02825 [Halobacterium sp. DL1]
MGFLDSFGQLASSIIAVVLLLVLAVVSFFITIFIVDAGAALANLDPSPDFVTLAAAVLTAGAIVGGASPLSAIATADTAGNTAR